MQHTQPAPACPMQAATSNTLLCLPADSLHDKQTSVCWASVQEQKCTNWHGTTVCAMQFVPGESNVVYDLPMQPPPHQLPPRCARLASMLLPTPAMSPPNKPCDRAKITVGLCAPAAFRDSIGCTPTAPQLRCQADVPRGTAPAAATSSATSRRLQASLHLSGDTRGMAYSLLLTACPAP